VRAFFHELWLRIKSLLNRKQLDRDLEDARHGEIRRGGGASSRRKRGWCNRLDSRSGDVDGSPASDTRFTPWTKRFPLRSPIADS